VLIYENTVDGLLDDIDADRLVEEIEAAFSENECGRGKP